MNKPCFYLDQYSLQGFLDQLQDLPNNFERIISNAIAYLIAACFTLGVILAIIGVIKWATGWDDRGGKKTVVKGIVLIGLSLLGGGVGITITSFA
ncbi:MAG: hypothetical protein ACTSQB_04870 [Candidatus Heimdallarchaeota archaeon]